MDLECEQMDVVTAFLNGDLDENIYMEIPEGLKSPKNGRNGLQTTKVPVRVEASSSPVVR